LPWDSDFWGFPVAEYRASGFSYGEIRRTLLRGQKEKKRCIFFFLPTGPIRAHHRELEKEKIGLVEQRILMARKTLPSPTCSVPMNLKDVQIRRAKKSDLPTICGLVRRLHRNTRFFKDPRFSRKRAEMLYEKWIRKDFKFGQIFVAAFSRHSRLIGGYITCEILPGKVGRIGLLGVDPHFQGRGMGHRLVLAALDWFGGRSCLEVRVMTQTENRPALRLYRSTGFQKIRAESCLHWWSS